MEIKLKPLQWEDFATCARVNALGKRYLVRLCESGWVAQADGGDFFHECGLESRDVAKAACELDMLELCKYAVEVVSDHIPDATKMVNSWQPIRTAPKDGSTIIVLSSDESNPIAMSAHWGLVRGEGFCWRIGNRAYVESLESHEHIGWAYNPTHWMPLPKPPKEGEK